MTPKKEGHAGSRRNTAQNFGNSSEDLATVAFCGSKDPNMGSFRAQALLPEGLLVLKALVLASLDLNPNPQTLFENP